MFECIHCQKIVDRQKRKEILKSLDLCFLRINLGCLLCCLHIIGNEDCSIIAHCRERIWNLKLQFRSVNGEIK